jgi:hypothetical protein
MLAHMRKAPAVILGVFLAGSPIHATGAEDRPLTRAAMTEAMRLVVSPATQVARPPAVPKRSWITRHPVIFGTLVGTGGGAAVGLVIPSCRGSFSDLCRGGAVLSGAVIGAGSGALIGFAAGR